MSGVFEDWSREPFLFPGLFQEELGMPRPFANSPTEDKELTTEFSIYIERT